MQHRLLRRTLVVAAATLGVVLAGCSAGGGRQVVSSGVAPEAQRAAGVAEAARTTAAASTARFAVTVRTDPAGGDPSIEVDATGAVDAAAGRAQVSAEVSGRLGGMDEGTTVEIVHDGDRAYVKAPFTEVLGGRPWVAVPAPELDRIAQQLDGALPGDPDSFLSLLEGAGGEVTTLGTEDVRGEATRHVAVDLDVERLLEQAEPEQRAAIEQHLAARGVSLDDLAPLPAEAWIDDDGLVRRFTVSFDLAQLGTVHPDVEATGVITETVELYDVDEPVSISVPPASEVHELDLAALLPSGSGLGD